MLCHECSPASSPVRCAEAPSSCGLITSGAQAVGTYLGDTGCTSSDCNENCSEVEFTGQHHCIGVTCVILKRHIRCVSGPTGDKCMSFYSLTMYRRGAKLSKYGEQSAR